MIYDFLFMICVRLVNSHIITNLRESVCPGLFHRQFVLCVNTMFVVFAIADKINVRQAKMQNLLDFFGGALGSCVILKFLFRNSIVRKLFFHRGDNSLSSRWKSVVIAMGIFCHRDEKSN